MNKEESHFEEIIVNSKKVRYSEFQESVLLIIKI